MSKPAQRQPFHVRLKQFREAAGLSQAALAKAAEITRQSLNALESGKTNPLLKTAQDLAKALGMTLAELIGE